MKLKSVYKFGTVKSKRKVASESNYQVMKACKGLGGKALRNKW
jgi:hypothetical protein